MITPDQIRNSAKFGSPLRAEVLLEIADRLEKLEAAPTVAKKPRAKIMSATEESELRDRLRKTRQHLNAHINLAAALMEPKPWVGLTNEEIVYLSKTVGNAVINDGRFARAIEAKLKEKNCG